MVVVYRAHDPLRAYLVKNLLESHGIAAVLLGEAAHSCWPLGDIFPVQVLVLNDDNASRARQLIKQARKDAEGPSDTG